MVRLPRAYILGRYWNGDGFRGIAVVDTLFNRLDFKDQQD